jgi:basic amino acid/polyamine antiporter, APA family
MTDVASPAASETHESRGMFVRKATGLTRDISFPNQVLLNLGPAAPGIGLAVSTFVVLGIYPGAHIISAFWLTALAGLAVAIPYGLLSAVIPRSGADYVLVSRSLGGPFGLASSFSLVVSQMLGIAFIASTFATVGIVPALSTIGIVSGNSWWLDAGTTLSSKTWTFVLSLAMLLIGVGIAALPNRVAMRVQRIGYAVAGTGMLLGVIVMLATSTSSFTSKFNDLVGSGSYDKILKAADVAAPGTSWSATVPAIGALSFLFLFSWWTTNYGGEIRGARSLRNLGSMAAALAVLCVLFSVVTAALFHMVGDQFVAAANAANGTADYPLSVPPFWFAFAAIATKSTFVALLLVVTFLFWFPIWTFIQFAIPTRALFAWSFDGVLPRRTAYVSERLHSPLVALAITAVLATAALAWEIFSSSFFDVYALMILLFLTPMISVAASAILLPWLRPHLWRGSPLPGRFLGLPLMTLAGVVALAVEIFILYVFLHYDGLGVANDRNTILLMVGLWAGGFVLYYVARAIQLRRGVDIALNYAAIPPE